MGHRRGDRGAQSRSSLIWSYWFSPTANFASGPAGPGLAGALTSALRQRPAPSAPESPGRWRASTVRQDPRGHPHDLFYPGLTRGLGWHARESRAGAARAAPRACSIKCLRAIPSAMRLRAYVRSARAHARAAHCTGTRCCTMHMIHCPACAS